MPSEHARHYLLDPAITFLNHGSFGAAPRLVLDAQTAWGERLERHPIQFLARDLDGHLAATREVLGAFVGADPDDLGFVTNATAAVNAVIRSMRFAPGDELLTTDHEYNAVLNVLRHVAERDGARVVVARLPFPPPSAEALAEPILAAATDRTRLAVISHITSPTGLVLPIERIVTGLAERGIDTLVDGAHAPGQVPLDLDRLGAAWYTGNLHKWVCAPKGAGFLHARRDRQPGLHPNTISHGLNAPLGPGRGSRYRAEFDWQGTLDPSAWLAIPDAIRFVGGLLPGGWPAVIERNHGLALAGRDRLAAALGHSAGSPPDDLLGAMAALPMPTSGPLARPIDTGASSPLDTDPLQLVLYERFGIEVPIGGWPVPAAESPDPAIRTIRISMAIHNDLDDVDRLVAALATIAAE